MKAKQLMSLLLVGSALALASCDPAGTTSSSPTQSPSDTGNSQTSPVDTGSSSSPSSEEQSTPEPSKEYAISQIEAKDQTYTVRGVVDAKTTKGFVITDGTASVYVNLNAEPSAYSIGDYLEVEGKIGAFNGMFQFTAEAKIAKLSETPSYTIPEPKTLTAADLDKWSKATSFAVTDMKEYKWQATAGKAGDYFTLNLAGSEVTVEPSYKPDEFNTEEGATYEVTAYFAGYAGEKYGNYAAFYLTSLTKTSEGEDPTPDPDPEPSDDYAIGQITSAGTYTIRGVVDALTTQGLIITDGADSIYYHDRDAAAEFSIGDYVEASGTVSTYNGAFQFDYENASIQALSGQSGITPAAPTALTKAIADSWATKSSFGTDEIKEYTWTAVAGETTVTSSKGQTTYYLFPVDGSNTTIEAIAPTSDFSIEVGATYTVTAYFGGFYKTYASIYLTSLTKTGDATGPAETKIANINKVGNYTVKGVIDAITTKGFVVNDGTAAIYYHLNSTVPSTYKIGTAVQLSGMVSSYHGFYQFTKDDEVTVLNEDLGITIPAATPLTAEIADSWVGKESFAMTELKKYTWTSTAGKISADGKSFFTLKIDGSDALIEPSYTPSSFVITTGATYNVTAYFGGYSTSSDYAAVYLTNLVAAD